MTAHLTGYSSAVVTMRRGATEVVAPIPIGIELRRLSSVIRAVSRVACVFVVAGCAPRSLLRHAIDVRGGSIEAVSRTVEADVALGFPGRWEARVVFLLPDRYAWTLLTSAEPNHYTFDGATVRGFIGTVEVSNDASPAAALRTHARFAAVMLLDALRRPGVEVKPVPPSALPSGAVDGLEATFTDNGDRFVLAFDVGGRLVRIEGPLILPPLTQTRAVAAFSDFRRVGRWSLPFETVYTVQGRVVLRERATAICPNPVGLTDANFRTPWSLPDCR
jgi:hypothetical protein